MRASMHKVTGRQHPPREGILIAANQWQADLIVVAHGVSDRFKVCCLEAYRGGSFTTPQFLSWSHGPARIMAPTQRIKYWWHAATKA